MRTVFSSDRVHKTKIFIWCKYAILIQAYNSRRSLAFSWAIILNLLLLFHCRFYFFILAFYVLYFSFLLYFCLFIFLNIFFIILVKFYISFLFHIEFILFFCYYGFNFFLFYIFLFYCFYFFTFSFSLFLFFVFTLIFFLWLPLFRPPDPLVLWIQLCLSVRLSVLPPVTPFSQDWLISFCWFFA